MGASGQDAYGLSTFSTSVHRDGEPSTRAHTYGMSACLSKGEITHKGTTRCGTLAVSFLTFASFLSPFVHFDYPDVSFLSFLCFLLLRFDLCLPAFLLTLATDCVLSNELPAATRLASSSRDTGHTSHINILSTHCPLF